MKTDDVLYATSGQIEDIMTEHYIKTGFYLPFQNAVLKLLQENQLLHVPKKPIPQNIGLLSTDAFLDMIHSTYVNVQPVIAQNHDKILYEAGLFSKDRNILAFKALPYKEIHLRSHDHFVINYVYSGTASLYFEKNRYDLVQGDITIIAPYSLNDIRYDNESILIRIFVRMSTFHSLFNHLLSTDNLLTTFFKNALFETTHPNHIFFKTDNNANLKYMIQNLVYESSNLDPFSKQNAASWMNMLFVHLLRNFSNQVTLYDFKASAPTNTDFIYILKYIEANYQSVTLASLADFFNYSETYLGKLIKKNLNMNYSAIIRRIRMEHAVSYLETTDYRLYEIADLIGYESVDHFSRAFKKLYGLSPSNYRKQQALFNQ